MTDTQIRNFFGLDQSADLDKPRGNLEFRSYREAAQAHADEWGAEWLEDCRQEFNRRYHEQNG